MIGIVIVTHRYFEKGRNHILDVMTVICEVHITDRFLHSVQRKLLYRSNTLVGTLLFSILLGVRIKVDLTQLTGVTNKSLHCVH